MPFSLFDDLKRAGFHSSILTTYSVDPAFYDANIQYRLRAFGCQNNLLVADAPMLDRALEQLPEAFVHAGRKYMIVPIAGKGCFHPKIMLRYGKSKARLVLGSANATSAGWGSNRELLSALEWTNNAESADDAAHLALIAKAHDWLISHMPTPRDPDLAYKLDLLDSQSSWIADAVRGDGPQILEDGSQIDLLLSDPGAALGLGDQLIARVEGEVERLIIISPYWDDGLGALRRLHADFGGPPAHVFLSLSDNPEARQSTFPVGALGTALKPKFHPLGDAGRHRFLHAKLIMAQTRKHDYLLFGSANCTIGALGIPGAPGVNCEAAIFRRLRRGTIDRELELNYAGKIRRSDIGAPEKQQASPSGPAPFHPGRIERKGKRLIWSCPSGISAAGAGFLIAGSRLKVEAPADVRPYVRIDKGITDSTIVARVELADGRVSRAVIVSDPDMLQAAAPNPLAGNLKRKLDAVLNGESDLIDLARDVHLIFANGGERRLRMSMTSGASRGPSISRVTGQDYESPDAFRQAVGLRADLHSGSIAHPDNPALQLILQIVLRGIVQLDASDSIDRSDAEDAKALAAGEDQDDAGSDDPPGLSAPRQATKSIGLAMPIQREVFERNRSALMGAIERFEEHVSALAASREPLDLDFVTRTLFMIYLMLYGCSRPYAIDEGATEVLIPFSGIGTRQEDQGFLKRAARLVNVIWGRNFLDGMMARIPIDREGDTLPTPILTLVILSRWILAAILSEARGAPGAKGLARILEGQVPQMFGATSAFALTDAVEVEAAISQMAKHIGMTQLQAQAIQATVQELGQVR